MASKYDTKEDDGREYGGLVAYVKDTIRKPFDIVLSKNAQRAYLTTFLVVSTALTLFGCAVTAYALFYWWYIPRIGFERTIYLQFDNVYRNDDTRYDSAGNPYGTVNLAPEIVSAQRYDVYVELSLPRTPQNCEAGNFMLETIMYAPGSVIDPLKESLAPGTAEADNQLARSRRPAILSYRSPIVDQLYKFTELHWYLLGWRKEAEKLKVRMFEGVEFGRGWRNVPSSMTVQVQSVSRMQIYSAKATFRARFRGLRWLMYNHRIISAFIFVSGFWITEVIFAALAWAALSFYLHPPQDMKAEELHEVAERVKHEEDDDDERPALSDTERTFPSSSRQPPLRYESPRIKQEDEEEEEEAVVLPEVTSKATEADDEDEDEDAEMFIDSGLGTSMESGSGRRDSVRRRRGRPGSGDDMK